MQEESLRIDAGETHWWESQAFIGSARMGSRLRSGAQEHNLMVVAAGIAFFFFLALVPALGALVAVYGLVADPAEILDLVERLSSTLPGGGQNLIVDQLRESVVSTTSTLGWGPILGIVLALWSASTGTTRMITALNIAYEKDARSGFARKRGIGILLALGLIAIVTAGTFAGSNILAAIEGADIPHWLAIVAITFFWLVTATLLVAILSMIYRYAANRDKPHWHGVIWGASVGVALALLATLGLRLYTGNFNDLSETYGSLTTIIVALFYLFIVTFAMLLGAEIDADLQEGRLGGDLTPD